MNSWLERAHPQFAFARIVEDLGLLFACASPLGEALAIVSADPAAAVADPREPAIISLARMMLAKGLAESEGYFDEGRC